jgi:hypothetical protein
VELHRLDYGNKIYSEICEQLGCYAEEYTVNFHDFEVFFTFNIFSSKFYSLQMNRITDFQKTFCLLSVIGQSDFKQEEPVSKFDPD